MRFHDVKNVFFVAFNKNGIVAKNYFNDGRMTTKTARAKLEKAYPDCEFIVSKKYHSFCGDNYEWMVENAMKRIEEMNAEEVAEEVEEAEEAEELVAYYKDENGHSQVMRRNDMKTKSNFAKQLRANRYTVSKVMTAEEEKAWLEFSDSHWKCSQTQVWKLFRKQYKGK